MIDYLLLLLVENKMSSLMQNKEALSRVEKGAKMGKKIVILGTGAQGSTVAQRMDEESNVDEIVLADYDEKAVEGLVKNLNKAKGSKLDAHDLDDMIEICKGADLIVNALPLEFGRNVLESALAVKADYQDFAAPEGLVAEEDAEDDYLLGDEWLQGIEYLFDEYGPRFEAIGKLAVVGTGAAPGVICAATSMAVRDFDTVDEILNIVMEGVRSKRFMPFWWSPITAMSDMSEKAYAYIDGEIVYTDAFSLPVFRKYDYLDKEVRFVEHAHDEPVYYGMHADSHFKGVKNAYFKYGGEGIEFAEPMFRAGLLSHKEYDYKGHKIVPFDFVMSFLPHPPKFTEEIKDIIDEGIEMDTGCMVVEVCGKKDGKDKKLELHMSAPGLIDSFDKSGISAEMYLTGQGGALFTKLFVNDKYTQTGLITTDMLTDDELDYYFDKAADLGITYQKRITIG